MKNIINFIKYHNLFTIILGLVLLLTAGAFAASEDVRDAVIGEEIVVSSGIDNSQLLTADLDNFDMALQIIEVSEDEKNYYVDYTYKTLAIVGNVWQLVIKEETLTISKDALGQEDLGLYVAEELGEVADYELSYLKEVQKIEEEKGVQKLVASVEYTGLRGLILDIKNKTLPGYEPVVQPGLLVGVEPESGSVASSVKPGLTEGSTSTDATATDLASSTSSPETVIDSKPATTTVSVEATFEFHATKDGVLLWDGDALFQCKVNLNNWENCTSPKTYSGLLPGDYQFRVFATDSQGIYDETPATFSWTITASSVKPGLTDTISTDTTSTTTDNATSTEN